MRILRRALLGALALVAAFAVVVALEVRAARRVERLEGFARDALDGRVGGGAGGGPAERPPERVVWIGDSLSVGVGTSDATYALSRAVSERLGHPVDLTVLGVSGARVADAIADQAPALADLKPDRVFVEIGANDVVHLTSRRRFRTDLDRLLSLVDAVHPDQVVVLGIPEFGIVPLLAQPLRAIVGLRGHQLDEEVRAVALRHGAIYVDIARDTRADLAADPGRTFAADRYHLSDAGAAIWARATLRALGLHV